VFMSSAVQDELYEVFTQFGPTSEGGNNAYASALANYISWLTASGQCPS
jgi:hypothetical protein